MPDITLITALSYAKNAIGLTDNSILQFTLSVIS
jgi:hypothetical protein